MNVALVIFFIGCTAFFVAAEYSVIRSRMSRIEQLIESGSRKARDVKAIMLRLDEYLATCQLGNTLTNLALGWLGESTVEQLLDPVFELLRVPESAVGVLSFLLAFLILTFLEVVIGELAPKTFAIHKAEPLAMALAKPLIIFFKITYPFSWFLNRSARIVTGLFGLKPASEAESAHTEAELRLILSEGYKSGIINPSEFRYVTNIFELDERVAKSIMVPRKEIVFALREDTVERFVARTEKHAYDLYPVIADGDEDRVLGFVDSKEVMTDYIHRRGDGATLDGYIKPVLQVIETISAQDLLLRMQKDDIHLAVLVDEFGGTSGLLTIKDIIRQIVGDRRSEADAEGRPLIEKLGDGRFTLSGKTRLEEVNALLQTELSEEGVYTLGGWLLSRRPEIRRGDAVAAGGFELTVTEMDGRQIKRVAAERRKGTESGDVPPESVERAGR